MRNVAVVLVVVAILAALSFLMRRALGVPVEAPKQTTVSILDLVDDSPAIPRNIAEQVAEAERRNEGGLTARNQATLKAKQADAMGKP